jgi:hypothetical protein
LVVVCWLFCLIVSEGSHSFGSNMDYPQSLLNRIINILLPKLWLPSDTIKVVCWLVCLRVSEGRVLVVICWLFCLIVSEGSQSFGSNMLIILFNNDWESTYYYQNSDYPQTLLSRIINMLLPKLYPQTLLNRIINILLIILFNSVWG